MFKSDVDLYLTADGRVVEAGHPDAASLLVNAGREIPEAEIEQRTGRPFSRPAPASDRAQLMAAMDADSEPDEKAKEKSEDKAAAKSQNKGR